MDVVVFSGPSLAPADARAVLDAVYLPPAAQGDLYRAVQRYQPQAVGLIDGLFEQVAAVWHKEILWAMDQGVHVFGAASMGALRAAELAAFGMEGVGAIFAAYHSGALEDDDEVAVIHAPAEHGYRALSTALVDLRPTLSAAAGAGVIAPETGARLIALAKARYYPERSYTQLLRDARADGAPADELAALAAWLPQGKIEQKLADALALLHVVGARLATGLQPKQVRYYFERSAYWERFVQAEHA
jgi:hypothetical protein